MRQPAETEIRTGLRLMQRQDVLDRFDFQEDCVLDDQVGNVGAVELQVLVDDWQWHLAPEGQAVVRQLPAEAALVNRFQQAGTERAVDLDAQVNDPGCQVGLTCLGVMRHAACYGEHGLRIA